MFLAPADTSYLAMITKYAKLNYQKNQPWTLTSVTALWQALEGWIKTYPAVAGWAVAHKADLSEALELTLHVCAPTVWRSFVCLFVCLLKGVFV